MLRHVWLLPFVAALHRACVKPIYRYIRLSTGEVGVQAERPAHPRRGAFPMLAISVQAPGKLSAGDVAPPDSPDPDQVLLRVQRAGICGSDLHILHGSNPFARYPRVIGHEFAGSIRRWARRSPSCGQAIGSWSTRPCRVAAATHAGSGGRTCAAGWRSWASIAMAAFAISCPCLPQLHQAAGHVACRGGGTCRAVLDRGQRAEPHRNLRRGHGADLRCRHRWPHRAPGRQDARRALPAGGHRPTASGAGARPSEPTRSSTLGRER